MQASPTWRDLLGRIIQDAYERQRIATMLGINPVTLIRWSHNEGKPRSQKLHQLLNALPKHRGILLESIIEEFPDFSITNVDDDAEDQLQTIPSEFYARVFKAYATTPRLQRFWSISNLILQQALGHLDPDQVGMALTIIQCMPASSGQKIRSLREHVGLGTSPWISHLEQHAIFLGAESLAGFVVSSGRPAVIQNPTERSTFPAHWAQWEQSAAAYPLMRADTSAGCLLVSSTHPNYFLPSRQTLLQHYTNLLLLAFEPEEFYDIRDINLQPMPIYNRQLEYLSNFRQRVANIQIKAMRKRQIMSFAEAEQIVWQQVEEELLHLPTHVGN